MRFFYLCIMICKCERNITNRIYYDSKEKERCITCTRYIHMADVVTFNIVKKETKKTMIKEPTKICEQCGSDKFLKNVKVRNSPDKEIIILCQDCDLINREEIAKIAFSKELEKNTTRIEIEAINRAGEKLRARRRNAKHKIHRVKTLTFEDIEAL